MRETKEGYIDIHCHILPGVDDGAKNAQVTEAMLKKSWEEGIRGIVATPHHRKGYASASAAHLRRAFSETVEIAARVCPEMKLYLGSELYRSTELGAELLAGEALTMAGTSYVLAEFHPSDSYQNISAAIRQLQMSGYRPIVAHVERYGCLLKEPVLVEELRDMGCLIQINTGSVLGRGGFHAKRFVKKLLSYELVHFLGTDAHDLEGRKPEMEKCVAYIEKKYGGDYARLISSEYPRCMLENRRLPVSG